MKAIVYNAGSILFCFATILLFSLTSCRKETDSEIPTITINKPVAGSAYQVGDSISILAVISDNKGLKSLQAVLTDLDDRPVLDPIYMDSLPNPFTLDALYPITDSLLESGEYILHIQASDGINVSNAFVKIQISTIPRTLLYPLAITSPGLNTINVLEMDTNYNLKKIYSRTGDYGGSAVDSKYGHLFLSGVYQSDLEALNVQKQKVDWEIPVQQQQVNHWFESISVVNSQLLVSYYDGYVKTFDHLGNPLYTTEDLNTGYPGYATFFNNRLTTCYYELASKLHSLAFYAMPGGLMRLSFSPAPVIVRMFQVDSYHLVTFGNLDGNATISSYLDLNQTYSTLKEIGNDSLISVAAIEPGNYVFSTSSQLFWYNFPQNSMVDFASGITNAHLAYDDIGRRIYAASGKKIFIYSYPDGILQETLNLNETILDIHLLYSR